MFQRLKSLIRASNTRGEVEVKAEPADVLALPDRVTALGAEPLLLADIWAGADGLPVLDWGAVHRWLDSVPDEAAQAAAWSACERAWLAHLCAALGPAYQLQQQGSAVLVSTLPGHVAQATLAFVCKTVQRIVQLLPGLAEVPAWGSDILIVFDDDDAYYRYVSHYYPDAGEFAASSGMYIHQGCGHFVTVKADLRAIEPVIAHELTHACLSHLPIPAWLNEGLAVNTEQRLCPPPSGLVNPYQQHARHVAFWGTDEIQGFWSGQSFLRNDEGNELSYDLARHLVAHLAADWERFRAFTLAADLSDSAASAAAHHLGIELGAAVCAMLERDPDPAWAPRPQAWHTTPERGAFSGRCPRSWPD